MGAVSILAWSGGLLGGGPPCCTVAALWSSSVGNMLCHINAISLTLWDMDIAAPLPKVAGGLAHAHG